MKAIRFALVGMLAATAAHGWGPATHVMVANQLKSTGQYKAEVMYGAVAPDLYLLLTPNPMDPWDPAFRATHYPMGIYAPWAAAQTPEERALAWGYLTHNEGWGADHTAHITSNVFPGTGQGYVILKAAQLRALMLQQLEQMGMGSYAGLITEANTHFIVEYGIDLVAKGMEPELGEKLVEAAGHRSAAMGPLLARAYGQGDPQVEQAFQQAEAFWDPLMIRYGSILKLPMKKAVPQVAEFLVDLGVGLGVLQDPGADRPLLVQLIQLGLKDSMALCAEDFPQEIGATVESIRGSELSQLTY